MKKKLLNFFANFFFENVDMSNELIMNNLFEKKNIIIAENSRFSMFKGKLH